MFCLLLTLGLASGSLISCGDDENVPNNPTSPEIFASLHGVVSDSDNGEPIVNASVVLSPGGKSKTTGSDGRYEFNDLDPQQYTITVQKTGYQTNRKVITAVIGETAEGNVTLTNIQ